MRGKKIFIFLILLLWTAGMNYYGLSNIFDFAFNPFLFVLFCLGIIVSVIIFPKDKSYTNMIRSLEKGNGLIVSFLLSVCIETIFTIYLIFDLGSKNIKQIVIHCAIVIIIEAIIFWSGMIRVYIYSVQLGIKWRVIGLLSGWIPLLNIYVLIKILTITANEIKFEKEKVLIQNARAQNQICKTKYPVLLVHGVFFRDFKMLNYWGRIPAFLIQNGATLYYGEHQSTTGVKESGIELAKRIQKIVEETGCEKLNIIAHSKGGLDSRYAISCAGADKYVASLTTINTPHNGCIFADYLLGKASKKFRNYIADKYNSLAKALGDTNPDFIGAVTDLTNSACEELNKIMPDADGVYYQSVGSKMNRASSGKFPLNIVYHIVKHFDGINDGLVSVTSMKYGECFRLETVPSGRGISHADMIDMNRENIKGFDVRELYSSIIHDLKCKGL